MKMGIVDKYLIVYEAGPTYGSMIRSWGLMKYRAKEQKWTGRVSRDLLEKFEQIVRLPPYIQRVLDEMRAVQSAVDMERSLPEPAPLVRYPVKKKLYVHQTRAANMALVTFGMIAPEEVAKVETERKTTKREDEKGRTDQSSF